MKALIDKSSIEIIILLNEGEPSVHAINGACRGEQIKSSNM
jgi:hypothetical protein